MALIVCFGGVCQTFLLHRHQRMIDNGNCRSKGCQRSKCCDQFFSTLSAHQKGCFGFYQSPDPASQNIYVNRKEKKLNKDHVSICECIYIEHVSECGDNNCTNRIVCVECHPKYCPCGQYCKNNRFQKRRYAKLEVFCTENRGNMILLFCCSNAPLCNLTL